jgi:hypothetical protein
MTQDIYRHVLDGRRAEAMRKLNTFGDAPAVAPSADPQS